MENYSLVTRFVSIREVCAMTSISRTALWKKIKEGSFPKPLLIGDGVRKAFVLSEVERWMQSRIEARDKAA
ncbi:helix-turn-helix transcriptional regulator [Mesorhizobium cantuariense]|uniref:Helix-turn-helix transcriptional regulator n=1 Tax=Mesorhizobium cantuariense TaxID=1300275 RepID=A0ABV7MQQ1_9HYPH